MKLSWRRSASYRKQSIDLLWKSVDWFRYDRDLCHERVKILMLMLMIKNSWSSYPGPHFLSFGLNTEIYEVSLRIQSECGKRRTRITPKFSISCRLFNNSLQAPWSHLLWTCYRMFRINAWEVPPEEFCFNRVWSQQPVNYCTNVSRILLSF